MIARIHKSMEKKDKGFTLIELLVVIIIIGILAAIAIPVFLNQRKKAVDAGIKSDLRTAANEAESYFVDYQAYPRLDDRHRLDRHRHRHGQGLERHHGVRLHASALHSDFTVTGVNVDRWLGQDLHATTPPTAASTRSAAEH